MPNLIASSGVPGNVIAFAKSRWSRFLMAAGPYSRSQADVYQGYGIIYKNSPLAKILIFPVAVAPHILFSSGQDFKAYNYYSDALSNASSQAISGPLSPIYNGRNQVQEKYAITYGRKWTDEILGGQSYNFLGGINNYEMAIFSNGLEKVLGRVEGAIGHLANYPDNPLYDFAGPYGSLFGLPSYKSNSPWNLYRGAILYTLNPASQVVLDSWYWTPSLFTAQPGDGFGLKPGWYYGQYPSPDYDGENTLTSLKVSLKAILDTRYTGGDYNYGWAELVTEVDGVAKTDLNFYLQAPPLPVPSNSSATNISVAGTTIDQFITTGSDVSGFARAFTQAVSVTAKVEMWNFQIFATTDNQDSGVCVAVTEGANATFTRFSGFQSLVYESTKYHSHSTSRDGTILAIFESDDGNIISSVQVFDLFGTREPLSGTEYTQGGFTQLRTDGSVVSVEALTGCVIPFRETGFEPLALGYDLAGATPGPSPDDFTDFLPSLSTLAFPKTGQGPLTLKKVTCSNGVDAEYGVTVDDCFGSTVIIEDPDISSATKKKVGSWDEGGVIRGLVRGIFSGGASSASFEGIGSGEVVTLPETFRIIEDESGVLTFDGYVGDLIIGDCIILDGSEYKPDPACDVPSCEGFFEMTASSSCGQTASKETATTPPDVLTLTGPDFAAVNDEYVVSGGIGPYIFSFSGGGISQSGDTGTITSVGACSPGSWSLAFQFTTCGDGVGTTGRYFLVPSTLSLDAPGPGPTAPVKATTNEPRRWEAWRSDGVCNHSTHVSQINSWYRMSYSGFPNFRFTVQVSTNYTCGATVTVEDACGTIATLNVSAVP